MNTPEVKLVPIDVEMAKQIVYNLIIAQHESVCDQKITQRLVDALHFAYPDVIDRDCL